MANHTASHYAKDLSVSIDALLADDVSVKDFTRRLFNINYQRTRISDHELAKLMRACAIPRAFDAKIIGVLRGAPRAYKRNRQLLDGLKTFSFVQVRSDGYYVYHDNTRDVVLDDWRAVKNPNEFNRYKRRLLKFYVEQGQQCYESGKYAEALAEFHHAADLEPENGEIYCWLGMAHFELQDYNSALTDLNVAVKLQPKESANYYWRATTLYYFNKFKESLPDFTKAIKLDPKDGHISYGRGWTYYQLKNYRAALSDFSRAMKAQPEIDYFCYGRGLSHYELGNYQAAIADFSKAIELNSKDDASYCGRGITYNQLGNFKAAVADLTKAITLQPEDGLYYHWRGTTRFELQDYAAALADLTQAIKLGPKVGVNYNWRGLTQYQLKRYGPASSDFSKAVELEPTVASNFYFLALCSLHAGDYSFALQGFDRANELGFEGKSHLAFWRGVTSYAEANVEKGDADLSLAVSLVRARKDACQRLRVLAKVALLKGEANKARKHYEQALTRDCQITWLKIELRHLDELAHLFPSHKDILKTRRWFKSRLKQKAATKQA